MTYSMSASITFLNTTYNAKNQQPTREQVEHTLRSALEKNNQNTRFIEPTLHAIFSIQNRQAELNYETFTTEQNETFVIEKSIAFDLSTEMNYIM